MDTLRWPGFAFAVTYSITFSFEFLLFLLFILFLFIPLTACFYRFSSFNTSYLTQTTLPQNIIENITNPRSKTISYSFLSRYSFLFLLHALFRMQWHVGQRPSWKYGDGKPQWREEGGGGVGEHIWTGILPPHGWLSYCTFWLPAGKEETLFFPATCCFVVLPFLSFLL